MNPMTKTVAAAGLTLLSWMAHAAQHQICYETPLVNGALTGVYACNEDAGGSCNIQPLSAGMTLTGQWLPNMPAGTYASYRFQSAGATFKALISFTSATGVLTQRVCEINAVGFNFGNPGYASTGAVLTGFMTDASGLLSTAVWRLESTTISSSSRQTLRLPADFVAVGGGALGTETPYGALVVESRQPDALGGASIACDWRCWTSRTSELGISDPHLATTYAIGMRITGLPARDLKAQLRVHFPTTTPLMAKVASNEVTLPIGKLLGGATVPLSGSVYARADASNSLTLLGQFVTSTAPTLKESTLGCTARGDCKRGMPAVGWRVESTDHIYYHPGYADAAILGLPPTLTVQGRVWRLRASSATAISRVEQHPAVDVTGLPQGYALTGIGARVDWCCQTLEYTDKPVGNLLWKLEPRMDLRGASVASKDHLYSNPATITGYALGVTLE